MEDILAKHLGNLVSAYNTLNQSIQFTTHIKEHALSSYSETPDSNYVNAFGFHVLDTLNEAKVVIGPGVVRKQNYFNVPNFDSNTTIEPLSGLFSSLGNFRPDTDDYSIKDMYMFGSIYLIISQANATADLTTSFHVSFADPLFVPQQQALNQILAKTQPIAGSTPTLTGNQKQAIELHRFVIDLSYYHYDTDEETETILASIYTFDMRSIQTYGGYAEEILATAILPTLLTAQEQTELSQQQITYEIFQYISQWANLYDDFEGYWDDNADNMPDALKNYILSKFGIVIS